MMRPPSLQLTLWRQFRSASGLLLLLLASGVIVCFWSDKGGIRQSRRSEKLVQAPPIQVKELPRPITTTPAPALTIQLAQPNTVLTTAAVKKATPRPEPEPEEDDLNIIVRGGLLIPDLVDKDIKRKKEEAKNIGDIYIEPTQKGEEFVDDNNLNFKAEWHGAQLLVHTLLATKLDLKKDDISWVTQLTSDRLDGFRKMMDRWKGPIVAALYCRNIKKDLELIRPLRDRVDFHLILADLHPGRLYPVNTLRNVAIDNCRTQWIALVDADFVPNDNLYEDLLPKVPTWKEDEQSVYILPAFQLQGGNKVVPRSKPELMSMWKEGKVSQVHPEPGRDIAHKHTNYEKYKTATEPYEVKYQLPFEPYFVADKQRLPRYDASFLGYGNDKTGHCYEIFQAGIKYVVLPDTFVFHQDHPRGDWLVSDVEWDKRGPAALGAFMFEMEAKYPETTHKREITALAGIKGENCTTTCRRSNMACHQGYWREVNDCKVLLELFKDKCNGGCNNNFFGNDLPAYNYQHKLCLTNSKPADYSLSCAIAQVDSERVCPCGEIVAEWLNHHWIQKAKAVKD